MENQLVCKLTDFQLMKKYYFVDETSHQVAYLFTIIAEIAENSSSLALVMALDLLSLEISIMEYMDYLRVLKRFHKMEGLSDCAIKYDSSGFSFEGHHFNSMDEVEKAFANKAFL